MSFARLRLLGKGLLALAFGIATGPVAAQTGTLRLVAPGVWFREVDPGEDEWLANNVVIEMRDYLIVVDANMPRGALSLLENIRKVSSKPVRYVINTHAHADHLYGNQIWIEQGATAVAHAGVLEDIKLHEPIRWQTVAKVRADVRDLAPGHPVTPTEVYSKSLHVISDGERRVELHHFGWGHTRGDSFVYLPKERLLVTGDMTANVRNSNSFETRDAYVANWPKILAATLKLRPRIVASGHGALGGPEVIRENRRFFLELHAAVAKAIRKGQRLEDLVQWQGGKPATTSITLPPDIQARVYMPMLAQQVIDTFQEITQHRPIGDIPKNWNFEY